MTERDPTPHAPPFARAVLGLAVAFVALAVVVGWGLTGAPDAWVYQRTLVTWGSVGRDIAEAINEAGSVPVAGLAAVVGLGLAGVQRDRTWLILLAPLATIPVEVLAKNVIPRTMVDNLSDIQLGPFLTIAAPYTFPSGNMARVAALVIALLAHPTRARVVDFRTRPGIAVVVVSAVVLGATAWSHLAMGDHWASDVLGGLLLGAGAALALAELTRRHRSTRPN